MDTVYNPDDQETFFISSLTGPVGFLRGDLSVERRRADGTVAGTAVINRSSNVPGAVGRLSAALVNDQLHVCAVGSMGRIWVEARRRTSHAAEESGQPEGRYFLQGWFPPEEALGLRGFVDVACAGLYNERTATDDLQVLGVTADGRLLRAVLAGSLVDGSRDWAGWEDLESSIGRDLGEFARVDADARHRRPRLAVAAVTKMGRVWYLSNAGATWEPPRDIVGGVNSATAPFSQVVNANDVAVAYCDTNLPARIGSDADWELNVVIRPADDKTLLHTILAGVATDWGPAPGGTAHVSSLWKPFVDLPRLTGYSDPGGSRHLGEFTVGEALYPSSPTPSQTAPTG